MDEENAVYLHNGVIIQLLKKNNDMKLAGKWMELEKIILSEVTQTQKDKHDIFSLISGHYLLGKG